MAKIKKVFSIVASTCEGLDWLTISAKGEDYKKHHVSLVINRAQKHVIMQFIKKLQKIYKINSKIG